LVAPIALAQSPSGTLKGRVKSEDGTGLPGVLLVATSPNLQGSRTTTTGGSGDYKLGYLPPGLYTISYELEGFATVTRDVKINAAQTSISDVGLPLSSVSEEIVVTSNQGTISETNTLATTVTAQELDRLPIGRTPLSAVNLSPGVSDTGPSSSPSIQGSFSYENLFLINGVSVNENIRGSFLPLFIEDAIQETTTTTTGVSAEYGRFSGGVVNVITKSGGNRLSGSVRSSYTNESWVSAKNNLKFDEDYERLDKINPTYEVTLGGPIWKDKFWFFLAGRDRESDDQGTTVLTNISYPKSDEEQRIEAKATISLTPSHSLVGSFLEIERTRSGATFGNVLDLRSLNNRTDPQEIKSVNYNGILTNSLFIEAQYSERDYEIGTGLGGPPDLIDGTMIRHRPTSRRFWSSTFCGTCEPEIRNNEDQLIKGSYFLSTDKGSHDFVFGYDTFSDIRFSVNHQTGSDFQVWGDDLVIGDDNTPYPRWTGPATWVVWWPPVGLDIAQSTDFETNSFFVNDSWQLNDKWSFNLGVRYDSNDGIDSSGALVTDDSKISPRLGLSYDVKGDGDLVINASLGTYVAAIANTGNVADGASTGGALAGFFTQYTGPVVNGNCLPSGAGCVTSDVALGILFDWYFANGGTQNVDDVINGVTTPPNMFYSCIPGVTKRVPDGFISPSVDEISVGVIKRLGSKGLVRADVVLREWEDFYSERNRPDDAALGSDISELGNFGNNVLERDYMGVLLSARYRFTNRFTLAGNYTWSEAEGNINGEFGNTGPVSASPNQYAQYKDVSWNRPVGRLSNDQTHKMRVWGMYDILQREHHYLNVSLLQNYFSGTPYGAVGGVDPRSHVTNPGYSQPPNSVGYYFTPRDAFHTGDTKRTDLALNYAFKFKWNGKQMEVFLQPEVINIFDEDGIGARSAGAVVLDATSGGSGSCPASPTGSCLGFNPFDPNDAPQQNVHWAKNDDFGIADSAGDFQSPRIFRLSVGFRF
jgi:hypothetical protein